VRRAGAWRDRPLAALATAVQAVRAAVLLSLALLAARCAGTGSGTAALSAWPALAEVAAAPPHAGLSEETAGAAAARWTTVGPGRGGGAVGTRDDWGRSGAIETRHVTLLAGVRSLDSDWALIDDQYALGVEVDEHDATTAHGFEAGLLLGHDDDSAIDPFFGLGEVDLESDAIQAWAGWRRTFRPQERGLHPYVAAGLAVLWTTSRARRPASPSRRTTSRRPRTCARTWRSKSASPLASASTTGTCSRTSTSCSGRTSRPTRTSWC
jgi:hypothetical protein